MEIMKLKKLDQEHMRLLMEYKKLHEEKENFEREFEHLFKIVHAYEEELKSLEQKIKKIRENIEKEIGENTDVEGFTFYVHQKYEDVEIIDKKLIPQSYVELDLERIKWNLIEGNEVPGAKLVKKPKVIFKLI
jgi:chromosome segregation ATPase